MLVSQPFTPPKVSTPVRYSVWRILTISLSRHALYVLRQRTKISDKRGIDIPVPVYRACTTDAPGEYRLQDCDRVHTVFKLGVCRVPELG